MVWLALSSEIYSSLGLRRGDTFAEINTMGLAWMANIGGIITPIGHATNALGIGLIATATGRSVGFVTWSVVGMVAGVSLMLAAFVVVRYFARPDVSVLGTPQTTALLRAHQEALPNRELPRSPGFSRGSPSPSPCGACQPSYGSSRQTWRREVFSVTSTLPSPPCSSRSPCV